ncbi:hypothetical protein DFH09DRAFT_1486115 [Mycena vulgaris]|nr:hypothetical protein DFH09DRAFT_1486115 [Mycena vulgaris]
MPKVKPPTAAKFQSTFFVLTDGKKRVLIPRPKTYQLDICGGELTDISPDIWETAVEMLSSVLVKEEEKESVPINTTVVKADEAEAAVSVNQFASSPLTAKVSEDTVVVEINFEGVVRSFRIKVTSPLRRVFLAALSAFGKPDYGFSPYTSCASDWYFTDEGARPCGDDTPATLYYVPGDTLYLDLLEKQKGGKPVIYLFSPRAIDASVCLTLTREWDLSVVYPVIPAKRTLDGGESVEWIVRTHPDGSLTERTTGLDVAYLFWEALTNHGAPPSPPSSPVPGHPPAQTFSPITSDLSPADSALLSVPEITPYLDAALRALGLHTEARTSFITYWLPALLKHTRVALRFVPQAAYEHTARLDIVPAPDVVTRVFMLFKGVAAEDVGAWPTGAEDPARWRAVVGVDVERAQDAGLFRVLEWGGMEVLRR